MLLFRLPRGGYSPEDVDDIINNWTKKYYQPGGRSVYIKKNNYGYDVIIVDKNGKGIVSVIGGNTNNGVKNTLPDMSTVERMLNNNGGFSNLPFSY